MSDQIFHYLITYLINRIVHWDCERAIIGINIKKYKVAYKIVSDFVRAVSMDFGGMRVISC